MISMIIILIMKMKLIFTTNEFTNDYLIDLKLEKN